MDQPHSAISRSLRYKFREYRDFFEMRKSSMVALSSSLGNNGLKMSSALDIYRNSYDEMVSTIPYLTTGKKAKERVISDDLKLYEQLKNSVSREVAKKEYDAAVASTKKEVHVLGGSKAKKDSRN